MVEGFFDGRGSLQQPTRHCRVPSSFAWALLSLQRLGTCSRAFDAKSHFCGSKSLARALVSEVVHPLPKKLVTLDASDSVERALDVLGAARVYAAPVLDGSGRFVGLLTKQDIVSFLLAGAIGAGGQLEGCSS